MLLNSFTRPLLFLGVHVPNQESWRIGVFVYRFYLCCYDFTISPHITFINFHYHCFSCYQRISNRLILSIPVVG